MGELRTVELPIAGMDCVECTEHVRDAIRALPGVGSVQVFLAAEKASLRYDPEQLELGAVRRAVEAAGYSVPEAAQPAGDREPALTRTGLGDFQRRILTLLGVVFGAVLFVVVVGEWLGLFEKLTEQVPWPLGLLVVLVAGYPVFRNVVRAALRRQVIAHTLMSLGVIAALLVGQWATAAVVVFFMRVGDYAERFTTERARRAVKDLTALAPRTARVERAGAEVEVPLAEVRPGEVVVVRPGESIPVDGEVLAGQATVDQAAITGESMPVEAGPGSHVYAATLARLGYLRVRTTHVGADSTFGRVIKLVEEAEAHRADVQRVADRFSAYYLPVVAGIAALTLLLRRDPLAAAAVLVVACSCSFALATPIAMLASIGAGARRGLMIKGGRYLELLARADVLLIDKTGTLTLGRPRVTDVISLGELPEGELLALASAAERYSEHPLAQAVREAAANLAPGDAQWDRRQTVPGGQFAATRRERGKTETGAGAADFAALPGLGVRARVDGSLVSVGNRRMFLESTPANDLQDRCEAAESAALQSATASAGPLDLTKADWLEAQGKTVLFVVRDGELAGMLALADTLRPEVPEALAGLHRYGIGHVELLTGDNARTAAELAARLGIAYQAELLPEDKIRIVKEYQAQGHVVVMVGDGVNDAPALAQADVGIAMGAAGSDIAIEAAHIALMREDWALVPQALRIAQRTMRVVTMNLAFTTVYNLLGLSLAAFGILPPILAAAAQSLPDLGILGNSSRLLRQE
jgi:P-type Cu+ transporter